ncbi:hypothetical protein KZX46_21955 (plasmid) [Polymorphobacter sp. PAMC 29334]|uniref:hypothetical protein n=1 Tax=Polymorphobacter sp. PAMC 29334 TaxID=2862331 RepID=UPI001C74706B|nr:hypothetical protein [Polymorphobacter sp. PAMC 29334]QYE37066.1 hypothetical protein KZX46_21955 [Polymorphobacter sp. PAMC 29334]
MDLDKPRSLLTHAEQQRITENLARAKQYGRPRKVWVEDGHVFVMGYDGEIFSMSSDDAIEMGRMLREAGADSLVNQVMDEEYKLPR